MKERFLRMDERVQIGNERIKIKKKTAYSQAELCL